MNQYKAVICATIFQYQTINVRPCSNISQHNFLISQSVLFNWSLDSLWHFSSQNINISWPTLVPCCTLNSLHILNCTAALLSMLYIIQCSWLHTVGNTAAQSCWIASTPPCILQEAREEGILVQAQGDRRDGRVEQCRIVQCAEGDPSRHFITCNEPTQSD